MLLEQLLTNCPALTVLATSRSRLLLPFEFAYLVPGLSLAAEDGRNPDAVELFVSRAAAGGWAVAAGELERVAALCRGLDGIALAIELAAARLPALGLDGLEAGLADRLQLLAGGSRVNDRHRSLRSALDWSSALLSEPERALLRRMSVVAGPFSVAAAAEMLVGGLRSPPTRCPPCSPGWRTRACWCRPRPPWAPATDSSRRSGSMPPRSSRTVTRGMPRRSDTSAGAWRRPSGSAIR